MRRPALALAVVIPVVLTGCGGDAPSAAAPSTAVPPTTAAPSTAAPSSTTSPAQGATADLLAPDGATRGTVTVSFDGDAAVVDVRAAGLTPGPHGFHVHATGACEPDSPDPSDPAKTGDFLSAGGHLAEQGQTHGTHTGDLPSLIAAADGTAVLTARVGGIGTDDVLDADGSAVMVHALPDNFGNVPERYAPQGPDETTTKTGDAGGRVACAVLAPAP